MDLPPSGQKRLLMFDDNLHGAPNIASLHGFGPNQFRFAPGADQVDLSLPIAKKHAHGQVRDRR
jgi:hypothetical protein